jgi:hypothetical protein
VIAADGRVADAEGVGDLAEGAALAVVELEHATAALWQGRRGSADLAELEVELT